MNHSQVSTYLQRFIIMISQFIPSSMPHMTTYKVYLNIYDFMSGNGCLEAIGLGAYHTGIEIGHDEYCYSVVSTDPEESGVIVIDPESAGYKFNRKLFIGETTIMSYRLDEIIDQMSRQFTCGRYHIFNNNCNHFSNELSKRLTQKELPKEIFRSTNILGSLCCCLPATMMNGQSALKEMMEEEMKKQEKEREKDYLLK